MAQPIEYDANREYNRQGLISFLRCGGIAAIAIVGLSVGGYFLLKNQTPEIKTLTAPTANSLPTSTAEAMTCHIIQPGQTNYDIWLRKLNAPSEVIFKNTGGPDADGSEITIKIGTEDYLPGYSSVHPGDQLCFKK